MGIFPSHLRALWSGGSELEASDLERILRQHGVPPEVRNPVVEQLAAGLQAGAGASGARLAGSAVRQPGQ